MHELAAAVGDRKVILFVGGGVSMNLGLPSWDQLVCKMAEDLGIEPRRLAGMGDYLSLAEYYQTRLDTIEPLVRWMDETWHAARICIGQSEIHRLIVELGFPKIYTTNFDRWLERAFEHHARAYVKVAGVQDLLEADDGRTQIVKFHGDLDDPGSLVLTEESYFERLSFESPLDIKLRADVLNRTMLFIGYSLRDINLRYLFYRLHKLWDSSPHSKSRPRSYIFLAEPNPAQEALFRRRGIETIVCQEADPGLGLQGFLQSLSGAGQKHDGTCSAA
jgi:hypothetical protein